MPSADKPRHRSGYGREETEQVEMVCLTVMATLGAYIDDLCVVGGLVPQLLIDRGLDPTETEEDRRLQNLEPDFAALVTKGLEFAFAERTEVELEGFTLKGERLTRTVPVCGPAAFVVLKALAFADRIEPKDAFDLVYVIRRYPGAPDSIVERLVMHAETDGNLVGSALAKLASDFATPDGIGPQRAASFDVDQPEFLADAAADAHGYVDDLLSGCRARGLVE